MRRPLEDLVDFAQGALFGWRKWIFLPLQGEEEA